MTKEEAINVLLDVQQYHIYRDMIGECKDNLAKAIDVAIDTLRETSLPTDIDEAAEEEYPDFSNDITSKAAVDSMREAFKAGAEWMAEQGVNSEGKVFTSAFTSYVKTPGIEKLLKDAFPEDTEVIVQIRKK